MGGQPISHVTRPTLQIVSGTGRDQIADGEKERETQNISEY